MVLSLSLLISANKVEAASGTISISANKSQVVVGNSVSFTVNVKYSGGMSALQYNISYDSSMLSLTSGSSSDAVGLNNVKNKSYTFTFRAKKSGSATFKFNAKGSTWSGDSEINFSTASKSVKIITQEQLEASYSKNNNLSSLAVEGATLSPSFTSSVTSYTVNLPPNTETIKITGKKADSTASVSGLGEHSVEDGKNTIKVVVTAQNGASKTYTITALVEELDPINVSVNDEEYTIVRKEKLLASPSTEFKKTTIKIADDEVPALLNEKAQIFLIGLKDKDGNITLFVYDEKTNSYKKYNQYNFKNITLYINDKNLEIAEAKKEITYDEKTITAYTIKNDDYYYFYATNLETGKENLYRYDALENTVQRAIVNTRGEVATLPIEEEEEKDYTKLYQYCIIGLVAFIFLTYLIMMIRAIRRKSKRGKNNVIVIEEDKDDTKEMVSEDESHKITASEKEKLLKETEEELNRINNESIDEESEMINSINELFSTESDTKKKKAKKKAEDEAEKPDAKSDKKKKKKQSKNKKEEKPDA